VSARFGLRAFTGDRSGVSAIEFALVSPVLLLLVSGLAQFAWVQHCTSSLRYALSSASRTLTLDPTVTQASLQTDVKARLADADPNVKVTLTFVTNASGKIATATGVYDKSIALPLLPAIPIHYQTTVVTAVPTF
jgi:Flp pilus assembly protein TadG